MMLNIAIRVEIMDVEIEAGLVLLPINWPPAWFHVTDDNARMQRVLSAGLWPFAVHARRLWPEARG